MKVHIYDRRAKGGTLQFYLVAFVDEKVVALKHVDLRPVPDLKMEDVTQELQGFVNLFREEISRGLIGGEADDWMASDEEGRKHLKT